MSDISYSVSLRVNKDNLNNSVSASNITATMSDAGMSSVTLALSPTPTQISTQGFSKVGVAFFRNLSTSSASTVSIGINEGGSFVGFSTLRAGEPGICRLTDGTTYYAVGTAGSRLRVDITEG